jgi:hypothetical protein
MTHGPGERRLVGRPRREALSEVSPAWPVSHEQESRIERRERLGKEIDALLGNQAADVTDHRWRQREPGPHSRRVPGCIAIGIYTELGEHGSSALRDPEAKNPDARKLSSRMRQSASEICEQPS